MRAFVVCGLFVVGVFTPVMARAGSACVPGAQVSCACPGGASGVQVCSDDGARLGACQCATPQVAPPAPTPAPTNAPIAPPPTAAPLPLQPQLQPQVQTPTSTQAQPLAPVPPSAARRGGDEDRPRRGKGLFVAGVVTLGVGYFFSLIAVAVDAGVGAAQESQDGASCSQGGGWFAVPLVGAALAGANYPRYDVIANSGHTVYCTKGTSAIQAFAAFDTVLQLGGAGMLATGLVLNIRGARAENAARVVILPSAAGAPMGLTVRGAF